MHSASLVHRDMKPANVLLNSECVVKVGDFGLCRSLLDPAAAAEDAAAAHLTDYVATRWYRAPEILLASKRYREVVDIWSLGCVFAEMLNGKPLFSGSSTLNQLEKIIEKIGYPSEGEQAALETPYMKTMLDNLRTGAESARAKEWSSIVPSARDDEAAISLVSRMLTWDPTKRLTSEQGILHPYCAQFHDPATELKWPTERKLPSSTLAIKDGDKKSANAYRNALYDKIREDKDHALGINARVKQYSTF